MFLTFILIFIGGRKRNFRCEKTKAIKLNLFPVVNVRLALFLSGSGVFIVRNHQVESFHLFDVQIFHFFL